MARTSAATTVDTAIDNVGRLAPDDEAICEDVNGIDRAAPTRRPQAENGGPVPRVVMRQQWRDLLFLHWEVPVATVQALLPPGLTADTWNGRAYVGLVPFTMRNVRPAWAFSVPGLSHFHETNVRTYVHCAGRDPGVWFFSLDAANPVAVQLARSLFKLPYYWAKMSLERRREANGVTLEYRSERRGAMVGAEAGCHVVATPEREIRPARPGTLAYFLAERYLLYASRNQNLYRGQVHHTPYPLQKAVVSVLHDTLVERAGFARPSTTPHVLYAAGVDVDIYPLEKVTV